MNYDDEDYTEPEDVSDRSRSAALALAICGGFVGLHRFYTGKIGTAILMICTAGGFGLWWLYDAVMVASGEFRDADGRRIRRWEGSGGGGEGRARGVRPGDRQLTALSAQVDQLQREITELAERVDFAERMLAQHRERDRLPRS